MQLMIDLYISDAAGDPPELLQCSEWKIFGSAKQRRSPTAAEVKAGLDEWSSTATIDRCRWFQAARTVKDIVHHKPPCLLAIQGDD